VQANLPMRRHRPGIVRSAALRRDAFSLLNGISMGLTAVVHPFLGTTSVLHPLVGLSPAHPSGALFFWSWPFIPPKKKEPWQLPARQGPPDRPPVPQPQIGTSPIETILLRPVGAVEP
jgi:hypothetical protein